MGLYEVSSVFSAAESGRSVGSSSTEPEGRPGSPRTSETRLRTSELADRPGHCRVDRAIPTHLQNDKAWQSRDRSREARGWLSQGGSARAFGPLDACCGTSSLHESSSPTRYINSRIMAHRNTPCSVPLVSFIRRECVNELQNLRELTQEQKSTVNSNLVLDTERSFSKSSHCEFNFSVSVQDTMGRNDYRRRFLFRPPISVKITRVLQKTPEFRKMAIMLLLSELIFF